MQRRIQKWKRFLAIFLMGAMLLTNDYGVVQAIADVTPEAKNNQGESPANIAFDARLIVNEDDDATVVETGESFQYEFSYTVPSLGGNGGSAYSGTKLIFTLPEYVELDVDDDGKPKIMGID